MTRIQHYTITTGHCRQSPRSEVSDHVIAALAPLLSAGEHPMPGPPGYNVRVTIDGSSLAATVQRASDGAPLVTTMVCLDDAGLAAVLAATGAMPTVQLVAPCLLDEVHPTIALDPGAASWSGDFARCLAWAWIGRRGATA